MTEVKWDLKLVDNKLICGEVVWDIKNFTTRKPRQLTSEFATWAGLDLSMVTLKAVYKHFTEKYSITPTAALRSLSKQSYKHLLGSVDGKVFKACVYEGRGFRKIHRGAVIRWLEAKPHIEAASADNQHNIIPICMTLNRSPKGVKDLVGRANWRKLLKNSLTRNVLIAKRLTLSSNHPQGSPVGRVVEILLNTSSTTLKYLSSSTELNKLNILDKLGREGRCLTIRDDMNNIYHLVEDTTDMLKSLGKVCNPAWSLKRWKEEHDKASEDITSMRYSKGLFNSPEYNKLPVVVENADFIATLLCSPYAVANEGRTMRHCVASYIPECIQGEYCVYSITEKVTGERSTLGLTRGYCRYYSPVAEPEDKNDKFCFDQHYGKHNKQVDTDTRAFGIHVLSEVVCKIKEK